MDLDLRLRLYHLPSSMRFLRHITAPFKNLCQFIIQFHLEKNLRMLILTYTSQYVYENVVNVMVGHQIRILIAVVTKIWEI